MGRNKKGKSAAAAPEDEEILSEPEAPLQHPAPPTPSESAESDEQEPQKKEKAYHGNKLNRGKGGKKGKEVPLHAEKAKPKVPTREEKETENDSDGESKESLAAQMEEDLTVARREPVEVLYCPICTFPAEMCEFSGMYEQCRPWLLEHAKELADAEERGRKRRALTEKERLDRLVMGLGTKKALERIILIEVSQRKGRKMTTSVKGMDLFGHNLKDLTREWKKLYSCGAGITSSETKQDWIDIQGNVAAQLIEILPEKYNIPKSAIFQMEDKKKFKCYPDSS